MDTEEMIHFLEHMEHCDFCLDQLLQDEETDLRPLLLICRRKL